MRLIDADKIGLTDFEIVMCDDDYKKALKMLLNKIDNAPIIEQQQIPRNDLPPAQSEIIHCKNCKNSEHWYKDRRRCFLWNEVGVSVFDDGFCNYGERKGGNNT